LTNVFSASFVQLVSGAGNENERLAAERGKLGGAGSVRDPCGFGPDKARRHVKRIKAFGAEVPCSTRAFVNKLVSRIQVTNDHEWRFRICCRNLCAGSKKASFEGTLRKVAGEQALKACQHKNAGSRIMRRHSPNLEWDARCDAYSVRCTATICAAVLQS
jgi:hypothetical protein